MTPDYTFIGGSGNDLSLDSNPKPLLGIEEIRTNQPIIINSNGIIMTKRQTEIGESSRTDRNKAPVDLAIIRQDINKLKEKLSDLKELIIH